MPPQSPTCRPHSAPCEASRIAIVGGGPSCAYLLHTFHRSGGRHHITVFEAGGTAGPGTPFSPDRNGAHMLANIAGFELPPLCETLNQWARRQSPDRQRLLGVAGMAGDDRAFFPRRALGAFYADQMAMLLAAMGSGAALRTHAVVQDVAASADGVAVTWDEGQARHEAMFDRVILASGYGRGDGARPMAGQVAQGARGRRIGVLGSSLSAIDAAVEIAMRRGRFEPSGTGLRYVADRPWAITFLSRHALLPEADFWIPADRGALPLFNMRHVAPLARGRDGDLDRIFALFARQLAQADPAYARAIDLAHATPDDFARRHFSRREAGNPFAHARRNLALARHSHARQSSRPWRLVMLQAHEVFGAVLPMLSASDRDRFGQGLKRCFVDNYAAVPHLSVERILALHDAGVLGIERVRADQADLSARFDEVIDARGQPALGLDMLPFPTLRLQVCCHARAHHRDWAEGIHLAAGYALDGGDHALSRVHAFCLPFLLQRHPFIQGLVESAAMARACVADIMRREGARQSPWRERMRDALDWMERTSLVFQGDKALPLIRA